MSKHGCDECGKWHDGRVGCEMTNDTPTSTDEVKPTPVGEFNYRPAVSVRSDNQPQTELDKAWCETLFDESGNSKLIDGYKMPIELKQAILAHQEKAVREARIDELEKCCEECGYWHTNGHNSRAMTFSERIAELTSRRASDDRRTIKKGSI